MQPYTEAPNIITTNIDISSPDEIVVKLCQCDMEMFNPTIPEVQTLFDSEIIDSIVEVSKLIRSKIFLQNSEKSKKNVVVMSGCGTSGRIAFLIARTFNNIWKTGNETATYTIAGGDKALFTSQEAPEDDWLTGVNDLKKVASGKDHVIFIGITCGLSAPYVAGQLDYCMNNPNKFTPVLFGFNPMSLARNVLIDRWDKTFYSVAENLEKLVEKKTAFRINPVLGGEAITGSSRMKGGSMTKIILETIFSFASFADLAKQSECVQILQSYQNTCRNFYQSASSIMSQLLKSGGDSLNSGGRICYVSSDVEAVLGIIDATECPPTYGASVIDVRGFIVGGYTEYNNKEGDLSNIAEQFCIDENDFLRFLKSDEGKASGRNDTIIFMVTGSDDKIYKLLDPKSDTCKQLHLYMKNNPKSSISVVELLQQNQKPMKRENYITNYYEISINWKNSSNINEVDNLLPRDVISTLRNNLTSCCAKWLYNAVSTGAHILKGKVFRNYMVELKVSNQKLFHRSIGIIQRFCPNLSEKEARLYLLRSIYEVEDLNDEILQAPISDHIMVATPKDRVVPSAIIMATRKCSFQSCQESLNEYPVIREALANL